MDISTQQRLLYVLAACLVLGTCGAGYWATADVTVSTRPRPMGPSAIGNGAKDSARNDAIDAPTLATKLRGPLYDAPKQTTPPKPVVVQPRVQAPPPKPKLKLTLVGTIINGPQSLAIVSDESGKFDIKGVGESLELEPTGVEISTIGSEKIVVDYDGDQTTIRLSKEAANRGNKPNNNRRNKGRRIP